MRKLSLEWTIKQSGVTFLSIAGSELYDTDKIKDRDFDDGYWNLNDFVSTL